MVVRDVRDLRSGVKEVRALYEVRKGRQTTSAREVGFRRKGPGGDRWKERRKGRVEFDDGGVPDGGGRGW